MKPGSWKAPFLFLWRGIIYLPKKLGNAIIDPSERGKVRWAILGILILLGYGSILVYPQGYNALVTKANDLLERNQFTAGYRFDAVEQRDFNLGLDLQGGAHLVYEAKLEESAGDDEAEALAVLRDRIERRVNALGVSEPLVQIAGDSRLVVELAGVDVSNAIDQIGETPLLEFREPNTEPARSLTPEERQELEAFNEEQQAKAQIAYERVTSGQESFEDVAREVSEDPNVEETGGDFGAINRVSHPEVFDAVEDTLIGQVVGSIIETTDGYSIIRIDDRQETDIEMLLSHLLICYEGAAQCESGLSREEALQRIQELQAEVTPENIDEKAREFSTDPSASENGADLGWVGPGAVVESFEESARALEIGQISEPVETEFGFHLILKRDQRPFGETFIHRIFLSKKAESDYLPAPEEWSNTGLTGSNVVDAQLVFAAQTNAPQVSIQFDEEGTRLFSELTKEYLGEEIAIYLDGQAISIPTVQQQITDGQAVISGGFTIDQAQSLARRLKDGALPVTIELVQQQQVGATLGAESLQRSLKAGVIGLILIAAFMLLYYRILGLMAILALVLYGVVTLALFKLVGVTLTLSGIAGFVLSIGMAVDANVLVFERFREERKDGKDLDEAVKMAFERAWPSIRDGNISTLITCFILGSFGTSLVQGFALTLAIGILVSMFSAVVVTKSLLKLIIVWPVRKLTFLFGSGWRLKG
jgi:protein-export membrane protein SecD